MAYPTYTGTELEAIWTDTQDKVDDLFTHSASGTRWMGSSAGASPGLETSITPWVITADTTANTFGVAVEIFDGDEDFNERIESLGIDVFEIDEQDLLKKIEGIN